MFDRTIIKTSGQWWKFIGGCLGLVVGGLPPILWFIGGLSGIDDDTKVLLVLIGLGISIPSFIFFMASIRCPNCGVRWVWLAARTRSARGWMVWLLGLDSCPKCSYTIPANNAPSERNQIKV